MLEMKKQHYSLRSNYIMRLLKGKQEHELPLAEALSAFDIQLLSEDFGILLFYLEDVDILWNVFKEKQRMRSCGCCILL